MPPAGRQTGTGRAAWSIALAGLLTAMCPPGVARAQEQAPAADQSARPAAGTAARPAPPSERAPAEQPAPASPTEAAPSKRVSRRARAARTEEHAAPAAKAKAAPIAAPKATPTSKRAEAPDAAAAAVSVKSTPAEDTAAAPQAEPAQEAVNPSPAPKPVTAKPGVKAAAPVAGDIESRPVTGYRTPGEETGKDGPTLFFDVVAKLFVVVALMFGCAAAWKRCGSRLPAIFLPKDAAAAQPHSGIHVSTVPLGPQRCLHVATVDGRRLLLASTPQQVTLIATLEPQKQAAVEPGLVVQPEPAPPAPPEVQSPALVVPVAPQPAERPSGAALEARLMEMLARLEAQNAAPAPRQYEEPVQPAPAAPLRQATGLFSHAGEPAYRPEPQTPRNGSGLGCSAGSLFRTKEQDA